MKTLQKRLQRLDTETIGYVQSGVVIGLIASLPYWFLTTVL